MHWSWRQGAAKNCSAKELHSLHRNVMTLPWLCHDCVGIPGAWGTAWHLTLTEASIGLQFCSPSIWSHQSDHFTLRGHGFWAVAIRVGGWWQGYNPLALRPTAAQKLYKARAKSCFLRQIFALYKNIHHDQSWSIMINHTTSCFDPYLVRRVPKSMIAFQRCSGGLQSFVSAAALLQHHPKHSPEGCWSINQRIPRWKPEHPELTPREEI